MGCWHRQAVTDMTCGGCATPARAAKLPQAGSKPTTGQRGFWAVGEAKPTARRNDEKPSRLLAVEVSRLASSQDTFCSCRSLGRSSRRWPLASPPDERAEHPSGCCCERPACRQGLRKLSLMHDVIACLRRVPVFLSRHRLLAWVGSSAACRRSRRCQRRASIDSFGRCRVHGA